MDFDLNSVSIWKFVGQVQNEPSEIIAKLCVGKMYKIVYKQTNETNLGQNGNLCKNASRRKCAISLIFVRMNFVWSSIAHIIIIIVIVGGLQ